MTEPASSGSSAPIKRLIRAPRTRVYQAFLDPESVAAWLAPDNMRLRVLAFDPREGGQFRMALTYQNPDDGQRGKSSDGTDTYHGWFAELIPNEKIVEAIEFESDDPGFAGEMRMTVTLAEVEGGTEVTLQYENVPTGISPADNEAGSRSSLQKLSALVEG